MSTLTLENPKAETVSDPGYAPWVIYLPLDQPLSDEWFAEVSSRNRDYRIERNAKGDLEFMSPTGGRTGDRNAELTAQLRNWAKQNGEGKSFDSSTGFRLPNSSIRAPDASWVRRSKLETLSEKEWSGYLPLAPDFVIELRSPSDKISVVKAKMVEYIENGSELGWLIDPSAGTVTVYRPNVTASEFANLKTISGEPTLPGFELNLVEIW